MVFTDSSRETHDPNYGCWVVVYTEFSAKSAAFLLVEVYDSYLLLRLSVDMMRSISCLDLFQVLRPSANAEEVERLL